MTHIDSERDKQRKKKVYLFFICQKNYKCFSTKESSSLKEHTQVVLRLFKDVILLVCFCMRLLPGMVTIAASHVWALNTLRQRSWMSHVPIVEG